MRLSKGFSLAELLLAFAILVFVLAGLLLLFMNCLILNEANRNLTIATSHAQYVLEEIKNTDFADVKTQVDGGSWDWNAAEIGAEGLTALTNESIDTSASGTDPLDIRVSVSWQDRNSKNRNIELRSLFTDY